MDGFFFCFGFNPCFFILASAAAARSDRNFSRSASVRFGLIIGSGKSLSRFVAAIDGDVARCSSADPNRCPLCLKCDSIKHSKNPSEFYQFYLLCAH